MKVLFLIAALYTIPAFADVPNLKPCPEIQREQRREMSDKFMQQLEAFVGKMAKSGRMDVDEDQWKRHYEFVTGVKCDLEGTFKIQNSPPLARIAVEKSVCTGPNGKSLDMSLIFSDRRAQARELPKCMATVPRI